MATKHAPENSVTLALAELDRLEQARANFLSAKRAAQQQLGRQEREIEDLRARLLAERPRAWARVRRTRNQRVEIETRVHAQLAAEQAAAFHQRMAAAQLELETKRRRLAALEAMPVAAPRPARRMLEWSVPAAATVLVAFLGLLAVGETEAEAGAPQVLVDAAPMLDGGAHYASFVFSPDAEAPAPAKDDDAKAKSSKGQSSKPKSSKGKSKSSKPKSNDADKPKSDDAKPPVVKKNSRPIELGNTDGDPLG